MTWCDHAKPLAFVPPPVGPQNSSDSMLGFIRNKSESCPSHLPKRLSSGKVAGQLDDRMKLNPLRVLWASGHPEAATYPFTVSLTKVFDRIPAASELTRLHLGAVRPTGAQRQVLGEVIAYLVSQSIDETTVFELNGELYLNAESIAPCLQRCFEASKAPEGLDIGS